MAFTRQIDELEEFLAKAVALVDRISGTRAQFSAYLFRTTYNDLSQITRLAVCSILETTASKKKAYMSRAVKLCERAFRTLLETHIKFCVGECKSFQNTYESIPIDSVVKNYQESCQKIEEVKDILENIRHNRDVSIEQIKQAFIDISAVLRDWHVARPELDKKEAERVEAANQKAKPSTFLQVCKIIGLVAAFLAAVATAVVGGITIFRSFWG